MTTEYVLTEGDNLQEVARDLLEQAASPDQVHWSPRPDVYGGGVFVLADETIAQRTIERRRARRAEEAARIEAAQAEADKRDSDPAVAEGLATPAEAGFAANAGTDPGSAAEARRNAEATSGDQAAARQQGAEALTTDEEGAEEGDDADDEADDEDATPAEKPLTTAQKRAAKKAAAQKAADEQAAADQEKSE